jgi:hypothetical protein
MHQERVTRLEIGQQILRASPQLMDSLPFEASSEVTRKRGAQIRTTRLDMFDASAFHHAAQLTANGFDFGEFWQSRISNALSATITQWAICVSPGTSP